MFSSLLREGGSRPPTWASKGGEGLEGLQITNYEVMTAYGVLMKLCLQ